ncbi:hypothetical protein ACHAXA_007934 [Cyclostephanos tholiformis]|uniref:Uncharacterized protein n=1 Tax=Cyclostephanos tholiformis TaxID=382380 RepID=A0ABD3R130_9STRA
MAFLIGIIASLWLSPSGTATTLGHVDASFGFARSSYNINNNNHDYDDAMMGRRNGNRRHRRAAIHRRHHRRGVIVFRCSSHDDDHGHSNMMHPPSRNMKYSNNDGCYNATTAIPNTPRSCTGRYEVNDTSIKARRLVLLDMLLFMSRGVRNHLRGICRIISSSLLALSLLFYMTVQPSHAGSPSSSMSLDRRDQPHPTSVIHMYPMSGVEAWKGNIPSKSTSNGVISSSVIRTRRAYAPHGTSDDRSSIINKRRMAGKISLFILAFTVASCTYHASMRKSRIIRKVTPLGIIGNQSPLGNGVSIIRVCMALGFDDGEEDDDDDDASTMDDAACLLRRLHLEEKALHAKTTSTTMFASKDRMGGGDPDGYHRLGKMANADYLSNVASAFRRYDKCMKYGSLDYMRVPFAEEAVREYRDISREERAIYERHRNERRRLRLQSTTNRRGSYRYILATILLVIKGDHTYITLPFGIVRRRDMARALTRIATDARVEDCLIASELIIEPDVKSVSVDEGGNINIDRSRTLTGSEILRAFPNMVPLT